jgi:hypothetical protein
MRVRLPMSSFGFSMGLILLAALCPWDRLGIYEIICAIVIILEKSLDVRTQGASSRISYLLLGYSYPNGYE